MAAIEATAQIRAALCALPDVSAQEDLEPPGADALYVPGSHTKALSLDTTVVVGMRGAGKSVWTAALFNDDMRRRLVRAGAPKVLDSTHVRVGYSVDLKRGNHPSRDALAKFLADGLTPLQIWRGVLARHLADLCDIEVDGGNPTRAQSWAAWSRDDPEGFDELLADASNWLSNQGESFLLVFDALDTIAPGGWEQVRALARGALELALTCRPYREIRLKLFLRPDMEEDPEIFNFRDSSKLLHNKVELFWRPVDLYGLLFHILANNAQSGRVFRDRTREQANAKWPKEEDGIRRVSSVLRDDEDAQRKIVNAIAGEYMGTNHRRGYTYSWIPSHLADAKGLVAPRSFLLALRTAATETTEKYKNHRLPLHYEAIKSGVAEASNIRVDELSKEDYPWVYPVLDALRGTTVPLERTEIKKRWDTRCLDAVMAASEEKLPPRKYAQAQRKDIDALIDDLVDLGIIYRTSDGRFNIPDIFRVGFAIRRKGGVRPPARG